MVDPGEMVSITLKREFGEEALNSLECSEEEKTNLEEKLHTFFKGGREVCELLFQMSTQTLTDQNAISCRWERCLIHHNQHLFEECCMPTVGFRSV